MKQLSLILSIIATGLAGTLLFLYTKDHRSAQQPRPAAAVPANGSGAAPTFAIAYFDMDSLETNYQYFKDAMARLKSKEDASNTELATMERTYQKKIAEWQQKGNSMSQAEAEAANREYQQMQQQYVAKKQELEQKMESLKRDETSKVRKRLEDFLKDYNKDRKFNYIFSYAPEFMFYRDTIYNITPDLIKGLNDLYKEKK